MFPEVHAALKLDQHDVVGKRIHLVEEDSDMGGFLLHHFISTAVKSESNIVLIGLDQTLGHYHGVGLKLGVDLIKRQKYGNLVFIDLLKDVSSSYADVAPAKSMRQLYREIKDHCEQFETSKPLTIIFDKLTLLSSLSIARSEILTFVQYVQALAADLNASLITLCKGHSSRDLNKRYRDEMELDYKNDSIIAFLDHTSHLTVVVWPLLTGYSEVVTGNFLFSWKEADFGQFQYNAEEKTVKVFALGASSAVL